MKNPIKPTLKRLIPLAGGIFVAASLAFVSGCATRQTEDLLAAAGFKARPATTEQQRAQLKTLPANKVSAVQKDGKKYYVFPDVKRNVLYVGQGAEYEQYQKLLTQQEIARAHQARAEEIQAELDLQGW